MKIAYIERGMWHGLSCFRRMRLLSGLVRTCHRQTDKWTLSAIILTAGKDSKTVTT
jgi:hypothetical protein